MGEDGHQNHGHSTGRCARLRRRHWCKTRDVNWLFLPAVSGHAASLRSRPSRHRVWPLWWQIGAAMFSYTLALKQKPATSCWLAPSPGFGRLPPPQPIHRERALKMITSKWYLFPRPNSHFLKGVVWSLSPCISWPRYLAFCRSQSDVQFFSPYSSAP